MIYIISEESDITTNQVIEYLIGFNCGFYRINKNQTAQISFSLNKNSIKIKINGRIVGRKDKFWIRRARLSFVPKHLLNKNLTLSNYLLKEENSFNKSLECILKSSKQILGSYLKEVENYKLLNLFLAKQAGLVIPDSIITTKKNTAISFFKKNKYGTITKDLRYPVNLYFKDYLLTSAGTIAVTIDDLNSLSDKFFPIFFQERIQKLFELRVFVLEKRVYSMAIFSQENSATELDYRNSDSNKPNRLVPFSLPIKIKDKIMKFMKLSDLDTGSIDLIVTPEWKFVFLEVNPQGQLDWLSKRCNYYIERDIANYLKN